MYFRDKNPNALFLQSPPPNLTFLACCWANLEKKKKKKKKKKERKKERKAIPK
jgi:hypothetical protein